jgi:hypothetical protein
LENQQQPKLKMNNKNEKDELYEMGTENSDENTTSIIVWIRMEETIDANFRFGHKRSQKSGLIELEIAERSSTIVVVVSVVIVNNASRVRRSEGRAKHWFGNGEKPIGSCEEIWLSAVMVDVKWRGKCAQTHECVLVMHMVTRWWWRRVFW